jgi:hypothetical protein
LAVTQCDGWFDLMVTFVARLIALTCAIAVGVLCETLICEPAQAQVGAFGGTSGDAASLELFKSPFEKWLIRP